MDALVKSELAELKSHHESIGLMIAELEVAATELEGNDLFQAIGTIAGKYGVSLF